jgi:hypothetical protein
MLSEAGPNRSVVTQLRAFLAQAELPEDGRLPPIDLAYTLVPPGRCR